MRAGLINDMTETEHVGFSHGSARRGVQIPDYNRVRMLTFLQPLPAFNTHSPGVVMIMVGGYDPPYDAFSLGSV
ncbi:hypothetical protein [Paenibacillus woosongensis]|uniref:Uncharacterized protein n=1 Tax=Paenibacillus woosongensis TaxID=307580 RepID=A0ABQ4MY17_9BACL|nr:hypothetical protein [Paenibacillus woosongensis]GIP60794.1 hypothetical protein J15TS10_46080 [Paenibacillus woosongensis]